MYSKACIFIRYFFPIVEISLIFNEFLEEDKKNNVKSITIPLQRVDEKFCRI